MNIGSIGLGYRLGVKNRPINPTVYHSSSFMVGYAAGMIDYHLALLDPDRPNIEGMELLKGRFNIDPELFKD